VFFQKNVKN